MEIRALLIESELMLDHIDSTAEECRRLVIDRHTYHEHGFEYLETESMENVAIVAAKRGMPESAAQLPAW